MVQSANTEDPTAEDPTAEDRTASNAAEKRKKPGLFLHKLSILSSTGRFVIVSLKLGSTTHKITPFDFKRHAIVRHRALHQALRDTEFLNQKLAVLSSQG
ncbi:hypothetical protein [Hymenobacter arizonensis]|uniref:Uncharacterized protein n=1 Tax=Hymenobacter arizonensis TaxID=1227077 RepID=A0A1I6BQI0_HYMAR|nr:hypothetical protein [Hymenobacter arizonensis]SFQ83127.1 hypothetical protein SAMN04515668_4911 [Hymenobacter arizonensis]